jgi:predicted secreted protein
MRMYLILLSLLALMGCQDKFEEGCAEANCTVTESKQAVDITYTSTHTVSLGEYSVLSPDSYETNGNDFTCSIPQTLIDAGFVITPTCVIYGVPLKTLSGTFIITILDFETSQDKSVLIEINVTGGSGCNGYGNEVTIVDFPVAGSPSFSFCVESDQHISTVAGSLGITLPGNGCLGACTASLAVLESGSLDQSEVTALTPAQVAADYVLFDVGYALTDISLNLSPPLQAFCLLSSPACPP